MQDLFSIRVDALKSEMTVAKNCLANKKDFGIVDIEEVVTETVFPNLFLLMQVAVTIPLSSATCERAVSVMRRVKNWLRSSMLQERFSNLSILAIERSISNQIDPEVILNKFADTERRIMLK